MPPIRHALKAYRKEWLGTEERQLEREAAYAEFAERVVEDFPDEDLGKLAAKVREASCLRFKFLAEPDLLRAELRKAKGLLMIRAYRACADLCERTIELSYARVPQAEIMLGICHMSEGESKLALERFRGVVKLCRKSDEETAALAAYLAGRVFLFDGDRENAFKMFSAVDADFPRTKAAAKAKRMASLNRGQ